jgi:hypothetical protein
MNLSGSDGAGGPDVRSRSLAATRVDVVPLVVGVVVTVVHGDVVRRVPDVDVAGRRRGSRASISLDGDAEGKLDIEAQAEIDLDKMGNIEVELKRRASLMGRGNGGHGGGGDSRLHLDGCWIHEV